VIFSRFCAAVLGSLLAATVPAVAGQSTPPSKPAQSPAQQQSTAPQGAVPRNGSGGKVIFSRSTDENGEVTTQAGPGAAQPKVETATAPSVEDAQRLAARITALDLDVHLDLAAHQIAVRALVTVRNTGTAPLARLPLQISSSLQWERIRVAGKDVSFPVATLNSDADHTGQLHEAAVTLPAPLAAGDSITLDALYSGAIEPTAQRLVSLGTPDEVALHNDWDQIDAEFTGLRGFGNVVWYPVSSVPVILGDGARLFNEIGRQKLTLSRARVRIRLTAEFPHGQAPTVAVLCGHAVPLKTEDAEGANPGYPGVATAEFDVPALGFETPSLFLARRKQHASAIATAWATADDDINADTWLDAASGVKPFVELWLGVHPRGTLTLLDLPDPGDAPYETGAMLAVPLTAAPAERLDRVMVHALTHSYTEVPDNPAPAWLNEGLATFMETLLVEHRQGRDKALEALEADRTALALAEPQSPGSAVGEPLDQAYEPIYYRTKAAYVLWMLRDLVGDDALSAALRAYQPQPGETASATLLKLIRGAGVTRDLSWFFADWVDADKGLPDLSITEVFPHAAQGGAVLVAVNVANSGYAACEVPVTVHTAKGSQTERVFVPARGHVVERVLVLGQPTEVQVNDGTVPETEASVHETTIGNSQAPTPVPAGSSTPEAPQ
jgi:Peptidase family M1 domain